MVMIPASNDDLYEDGDIGVDGSWWPPPSETAAKLRELTERLNNLTERMNTATKGEYVWPPSLINKFVQCLKADPRAREILAKLTGSK